MIVIIKPPIFERIKSDLAKLDVIQLDEDGEIIDREHRRGGFRLYNKEGKIDLTSLTRKETEHFLKVVESVKVYGTGILAADLKKYLKASKEGIEGIRARTCRQAAWMLERFFADLPHHILFSKDEYGGQSHSGYYVQDVDYQPEIRERGSRNQPEYASFRMLYIDKDQRRVATTTLYRGDCQEMTCLEILAKQGMVPESLELMTKLKEETERFYETSQQIGKQCLASGVGVPDLDDESKDEDRYRRRRQEIQLDRFSRSTRVVVDVLKEGESKDESRRDHSCEDPYRWHKWNSRFHAPSEDVLIKHLEADDNTAEKEIAEVPVHPLVPCFDLRRHLRLRVHVNNLKPYHYDKAVADRLVLPERDWKMVNLLVDHSANQFEDVISGKGQSMNVLAVGPPGCGKTLTAEVFAEFKERPLYSVQCSQLGMDASEVEKSLFVVMNRANRWNAVLLLDEADVYIGKRGTDLQQNAIVGAFLRVLEYASCILFMTSNLGDRVDDAITSRCVAKLTYSQPSTDDQARIWRILVDVNKLEMTDREIARVAEKYPHLSGRDVKNLLKLASFVEAGKPITHKSIEYALQFKPTEDFDRRGNP